MTAWKQKYIGDNFFKPGPPSGPKHMAWLQEIT